MLGTFNETSIASYIKSQIEEQEKKLQHQQLDEISKAKIEGRIEAYHEFLERFDLKW
ncbi:hypothetical protein [Metabacillus iocasae]|uniref:Uncharacterized protein n=1 Tax=Priestia iocasae TaxID=2291674 RepID=A0ABS2QUW2_9BACI|nr:hypothetical protein [Metabacillus iocasae]MBM7702772.1 hypothetical protein [Metabacillus iocasae]